MKRERGGIAPFSLMMIILAALLLFAALTAAACLLQGSSEKRLSEKVSDAQYGLTASVSFEERAISLNLGDQTELSYTILPADAADRTVELRSSDESVVSVTGTMARGVGGGTAQISIVQQGVVYDTCTVTVVQTDPTAMTFYWTEQEGYEGGTLNLDLLFTPDTVSDRAVTYTVADETVAEASADGVVTLLAPGETEITAIHTTTGLSCTCTIRVKPESMQYLESEDGGSETNETPDMSLVSTCDHALAIWKSTFVTAEFVGETESVTYSSSDSSVLNVNSVNGSVTAMAYGSADICAVSESGAQASYHIDVNPATVAVNTGMILYPSITRSCSASFTAPEDHAVYLFCIRNDGSSFANFGVYIAAGQTAEVTEPAGDYTVYCALGDTWYGTTYLFGVNTTVYMKFLEPLSFSEETAAALDLKETNISSLASEIAKTDWAK